MSKLNKILLIIVIVLLVVLGFSVWKPSFFKTMGGSGYYAVYLTSGDLYFGKMSWFKSGVLSDARLIQQQQAGEKEQPSLNLVKFKDVFWGPAGDLRLNRENVLWITKLDEESQVVKIINAEK